jgi:DNA repair protein RadC
VDYTRTSIKDWDEADRPREKLLQRGIEALTDAELLALILATGTRELSAIDLARQMLRELDGLPNVARADVATLKQIKGIGDAKATSLVAAFELGRRKALTVGYEVRVTSARIAAAYLSAKIGDAQQEVFYALYLDRKNAIKADKELFRGGVNATVADPRIIFKEGIAQLASGIIVAHNHPSGNLNPSKADEDLTRRLVEGGKLLDMPILDHLIIGGNGTYFSFADAGLL